MRSLYRLRRFLALRAPNWLLAKELRLLWKRLWEWVE